MIKKLSLLQLGLYGTVENDLQLQKTKWKKEKEKERKRNLVIRKNKEKIKEEVHAGWGVS